MNWANNNVVQDKGKITISNDEFEQDIVLNFPNEEIADEVMMYLIRDGHLYTTEKDYYINALILNKDDVRNYILKGLSGKNEVSVSPIFAGYEVSIRNGRDNHSFSFDGTLAHLNEELSRFEGEIGNLKDHSVGWFTTAFEMGDYSTNETTNIISDQHAAERVGEKDLYIEDHNLYKSAYLFTHGPVVPDGNLNGDEYYLIKSFGKNKYISEDNFGVFQYFNDARDVIDSELKQAQSRCIRSDDKFEYFGGIKEVKLPIDVWQEIENGFSEAIEWWGDDPFADEGTVLYTAMLNKDGSISIEDKSTLEHDIASAHQKFATATFWDNLSQQKNNNLEL